MSATPQRLVIDILAVADGADFNETVGVVELIDHAIVANANPPEIACAAELIAAGRARRVGERFDARKDPLKGRVGEALQFLTGGADELTLYLRTPLQSACTRKTSSDGGERLLGLGRPSASSRAVDKILPEGTMQAQINHHGRAAPTGIAQVFDTTHGLHRYESSEYNP